MFHYEYKTENSCSQIISLDPDGDVAHNASFMGGCSGNLKAIPLTRRKRPHKGEKI